MTVFFDRSLPLYLTDGPTYMGVEVDVDEEFLGFVTALNALVAQIEVQITNTGSPEDYNQDLAEMFTAGLHEIWGDIYRETITEPEDTPDTSPSITTEGD